MSSDSKPAAKHDDQRGEPVRGERPPPEGEPAPAAGRHDKANIPAPEAASVTGLDSGQRRRLCHVALAPPECVLASGRAVQRQRRLRPQQRAQHSSRSCAIQLNEH